MQDKLAYCTNWQIWQEIEARVTRTVRRWQGGDPDRTRDIVSAGMVRWVTTHDPVAYPHQRQATASAIQACRAAARDEGLDYRRMIPTDPSTLPVAADEATPEAILLAAEAIKERQECITAADRVAALMRQDLRAAYYMAASGDSMAAACRATGVRQSDLSKALARICQAVTGQPPIRQRRRSSGANEAGQMDLFFAPLQMP